MDPMVYGAPFTAERLASLYLLCRYICGSSVALQSI